MLWLYHDDVNKWVCPKVKDCHDGGYMTIIRRLKWFVNVWWPLGVCLFFSLMLIDTVGCQSWPVVCFSIFFSFTDTEFPSRAAPSSTTQLAFRHVFLQVFSYNSSVCFIFHFYFWSHIINLWWCHLNCMSLFR